MKRIGFIWYIVSQILILCWSIRVFAGAQHFGPGPTQSFVVPDGVTSITVYGGGGGGGGGGSAFVTGPGVDFANYGGRGGSSSAYGRLCWVCGGAGGNADVTIYW
jgi:hypothetical protein